MNNYLPTNIDGNVIINDRDRSKSIQNNQPLNINSSVTKSLPNIKGISKLIKNVGIDGTPNRDIP